MGSGYPKHRYFLFGLIIFYRFMPSVLDDPCTEKVIQLLIVIICSQNYVNNPYLIAKLVEVLFVMNPNVQPRAEKICEKTLLHELSREFLAPALMQFYTGIVRRL